MIMLLLQGAPGCGKSTYIKENNLQKYTVSPDEYRMDADFVQVVVDGKMRTLVDTSFKNSKQAFERVTKEIDERSDRGELIVLDAMNVKRPSYRELTKLVQSKGYTCYLVNIQNNLTVEELLERNELRPEHKYVSQDFIKIAHQRHLSWTKVDIDRITIEQSKEIIKEYTK